jgi:ferredoxin-NADP reductase
MTAIKARRPTPWQAATLVDVRAETPTVKTLRFEVGEWPGHLAGQHADVRLIGADGYRAERSYSIASPPEAPWLELTIERLEGGEVSPFLTDRLRPGDAFQLRGPIGGHFVWSAAGRTRPLLLVAGGCGVVPLACMLRHRRAAGSTVPATLVYSSRSRDEIIYRDELQALARDDGRFSLRLTLTRDTAPGWSGEVGRIDLPRLSAALQDLGGAADSFVCGSDGFVEHAASLLLRAGQDHASIRAERFGPS